MWLYHRVMSPKDAVRMANSIDLDQTARAGAVWSGSTLFTQAYLFENFGSLQYIILESSFSQTTRLLMIMFVASLKFLYVLVSSNNQTCIRPSIKKLFAVPVPTTINHPTQNSFWHFWKKKLGPTFIRKSLLFSLSSNKMEKISIYLYLPNQKIQGRSTANKQFFKDSLSSGIQAANWYGKTLLLLYLTHKYLQNIHQMQECSWPWPLTLTFYRQHNPWS